MRSKGANTQMKVIEQYFPVGLFVILYKVVMILYEVVITFQSVDEILRCE